MSHSLTPFWVTDDQLRELNLLIIPAVQSGDQQAQAVHEELSIARTRFGVSRLRHTRLARALGHKAESFPIRLSDTERTWLLSLPLSSSLKADLQ